MSDLLLDTHVVVWALFEPSKLSAAATALIRGTQAAGGRLLVSAVTPIEVTYLVEKGKLAAPVLAGLWAAAGPGGPLGITPVDEDVARGFDRVPRAGVPDMPDRIIAATALARGIPLLSADHKIRALAVAGLTVVW